MPKVLSTELCGLKPGTESQEPLSSLLVDEETETERLGSIFKVTQLVSDRTWNRPLSPMKYPASHRTCPLGTYIPGEPAPIFGDH